ncbi:hypothetical protein ABH931_000683 [Streptacidiphilus sp. MAP12-33]|uniref:SCO3933 family regulatory protein n=1 Tax=Streptacidiphilus sp. MAP12-33 TaxID=3156266 RepID=UPI00351369F8
MPSFKIDLSTAMVFVAVAPAPKYKNKKTQELAADSQTGETLATVGLIVSDEGEGNLLTVTVPDSGIPAAGLPVGTPVAVTGLKARDWENEFNGEKRHGIAFRAMAITSLAAPAKG